MSGILQALLLGRRGELDDVWMERFARTGLVHVFAVSGLHIGMLAGMLVVVMRWSGVPMTKWAWIAIPLLIGFTWMTGSRASAIRACVMASCFLLAPAFRRQSHSGSALAVSAVIILVMAPSQLFQIGFLYSFILVAGFLLFLPSIQRWMSLPFDADPWAPPKPIVDWFRRDVVGWCIGAFSMSILAFMLSAPLTACYFNLFSPVALLGNLLAVPLAFGILLFGFPAMLLLLLLPSPASSWILNPASWFAEALLQWVSILEKVPNGIQHVRTPAQWELIGFYLLILGYALLKRHRWALTSVLLLLMVCSVSWRIQVVEGQQCILFDAGRGQMSLLKNGREPPILVDTGDVWGSRYRVSDLKKEGVDQVSHLFLTHADANHVGGLKDVMATFAVEQIYLPEGNQDCVLFSEAMDSGIPITWLRAGDAFRASGWWVEVLHPTGILPSRAADTRGLVLRISDGFSSVMIAGGADQRVEKRLLESGRDLSSAVLIAGHPSGQPSCSSSFLDRVKPEAVFFSGEGFQGVSPKRETAEGRVANAGIPLWRVPDRGMLRIFLNRKSFRVEE